MNTLNYHIPRSNVQTYNISITATLKLALSFILNFCLFCSPIFVIYFGLLKKLIPSGNWYFYLSPIGIYGQIKGLPMFLIGTLQFCILVILNCVLCRTIKSFNDSNDLKLKDTFELLKKSIVEDFKKLFGNTFLLVVFLALGFGLFLLVQYLLGEVGFYDEGDYILILFEIIVRIIATFILFPILGYVAISANYSAFISSQTFGEAIVDSFKLVRTNFRKAFLYSLAAFLTASLLKSLPSIIIGFMYFYLPNVTATNSAFLSGSLIMLISLIFNLLAILFFNTCTIFHAQGNNGEQLEKHLSEKINKIDSNYAE